MRTAAANLVLMILLVAACSSLSRPRATSDLSDAASTPFPSGKTTAPLTSNDTVYESEEFGFRLQIPPGYQIEELPLRKGMLLALGFAPSDIDESRRFGFPLGLTVYEKSREISLLDWFSTHIGDLTESGQPSSEEAFFYAPTIQNQDGFKGEPALQYLGGTRPVPYETLVDRGMSAIGFYRLTDYPDDYQPAYEEMLASLEFFNPTGSQAVADASPPPTATRTVCLDENARPHILPPRRTPLEVHFISDGDIWAWEEERGLAHQISDTGDARSFSFSPDGKVVAFTRGPQYGQTELWGIRRDGTNLRLLVSADELHAFVGEPSTTKFDYTDEIYYLDWIEGTHRLGFEVQRYYNAIGGCCDFGGYWQVDVNTGDLSGLTLPPETVAAPGGLPSPDGRQVAILDGTTMQLVDADGSNLRENVFSFVTAPFHEGGGTINPYIEWAEDSRSLLAITFNGDVYADDIPITTWRIPLDGSPAQELYSFSTLYFFVDLSPDQEHLAYKKRVRAMTNESGGSGCLDRISWAISDEPQVDGFSIGVLAVLLRGQRGARWATRVTFTPLASLRSWRSMPHPASDR